MYHTHEYYSPRSDTAHGRIWSTPLKFSEMWCFDDICGTLLVANCGVCGIDIWAKLSCVIASQMTDWVMIELPSDLCIKPLVRCLLSAFRCIRNSWTWMSSCLASLKGESFHNFMNCLRLCAAWFSFFLRRLFFSHMIKYKKIVRGAHEDCEYISRWIRCLSPRRCMMRQSIGTGSPIYLWHVPLFWNPRFDRLRRFVTRYPGCELNIKWIDV